MDIKMNKTLGLKTLLYNDLNTHSKMKLFSLLHFEIILYLGRIIQMLST